uniref:Uncharacterized protein n=1 Tax=Monomastix sp. (strain OKE-1) TaxID=141716 RepID=U5YDM7_MONSK|nr:hypothetical protein [Monomastix sp. OKE-1]AGZ90184.1 hypothetical protein [Monomastix sp. OKE-1]
MKISLFFFLYRNTSEIQTSPCRSSVPLELHPFRHTSKSITLEKRSRHTSTSGRAWMVRRVKLQEKQQAARSILRKFFGRESSFLQIRGQQWTACQRYGAES